MTRQQAKFYLARGGESFETIEQYHQRYRQGLDLIRASIPKGVEYQEVERRFLPNFVFGPNDVVATLGPDGLVVNTAKYVRDQLIVPFLPDSYTMDAVMAIYNPIEAEDLWKRVVAESILHRNLTMAQAVLNDGQSLLAVNDLFIGQQSHVSARYEIEFEGKKESHSSSGVIVSTGAGSTGWYRSLVKGALSLSSAVTKTEPDTERKRDEFAWSPEEPILRFSVREPFESRASQAEICTGTISANRSLTLVSRMPQRGVIFSDGVEEDFLNFNSGSTAVIGIASRRVRLARRGIR